MSLKSTVVNNHIKSAKYQQGKEKLKTKEAHERDITTALQVHNQKNHHEGESLSIDQQTYQMKVVTTFLQSWCSTEQSDLLPTASGGKCILTDRSHMANLIPFLVEQKKVRLKQDDKNVPVIFNGTTHLGET